MSYDQTEPVSQCSSNFEEGPATGTCAVIKRQTYLYDFVDNFDPSIPLCRRSFCNIFLVCFDFLTFGSLCSNLQIFLSKDEIFCQKSKYFFVNKMKYICPMRKSFCQKRMV